MSRWSLLLVALAAGSSACGAGWRRVDDSSPRALPVRTQVQVWQGTRTSVLHAVRITSQSISGVPFTEDPACDSCRIEFAAEGVDSLRTGSKERGFFRSAALVLAALLYVGYSIRGLGS